MVVQQTHYYPFGMAFAETTGENKNKQPYKYNGKELDTKHGLNMYDYSARYLDNAVPRFTTVDPLAEKYYSWSPYAYVGNNPMRYIDPKGVDSVSVNNEGLVVGADKGAVPYRGIISFSSKWLPNHISYGLIAWSSYNKADFSLSFLKGHAV